MSDPNETLENELRALRPADPSPDLVAAIGDALARPSGAGADVVALASLDANSDARVRRLRASLWLSWSVAAVAASFAVVAFLQGRETSTRATPENSEVALPEEQRVVPVSSTNTLVAARDEGVVYLDGGQPVRRVRLQFLDTYKLRAAGDSALIDVSYPREEIRLVPVDAL